MISADIEGFEVRISRHKSDQAIPPEKQCAMLQWARSRGVNPDVADLIGNQALGAKAVKEMEGIEKES